MNRDDASAGKLLRDVLRKIRNAAPLYEKEDNSLEKAIEGIAQDLMRFTKEYGEIELRISTNNINSGEDSVYRSDARQNNLAFDLFRQGLRRLNFRPGLSATEVRIFVQRFAECRVVDKLDEDFMTTLWQEPLENIHYLAVDGFTERIFMSEEVFVERFRGIIEDLAPGLTEMPEEDEGDRQPRVREEEEGANTMLAAFNQEERLLAEIRGDAERSRKLIQESMRPEVGAEQLLQLLSRFAIKYPSPLKDEELGQMLLKGLEVLLIARAWQGFADALRSFWSLLEDRVIGSLNAERFEVVRAVIASESVLPLAIHLDGGQRGFLEWCTFFYTDADLLLAPDLLSFVNLCPNKAGVAFLQNLLRYQSSNSLEPWAARLQDPNPKIVQEVLEVILGSDLAEQAQPLLLEAVNHPSEEVRLMALEGLGESHDASVRESLIPLVRDPSERVRRAIVQHFLRAEDRSVSPYLAATIRAGNFGGYTEEDQRLYCLALGELGNDQFLPLFQRRLKMDEGEGFFQKLLRRGSEALKNEPIRRSIISGLAALGSPDALNLIREVKERACLELASHCELALQMSNRGEVRAERERSHRRKRTVLKADPDELFTAEGNMGYRLLFEAASLRGAQPVRPQSNEGGERSLESIRVEFLKGAHNLSEEPLLEEGETFESGALRNLSVLPGLTEDGQFRLTSPRASLLSAAPLLEELRAAQLAARARKQEAQELLASEQELLHPENAAEENNAPQPLQATPSSPPPKATNAGSVDALLLGFLEDDKTGLSLSPVPRSSPFQGATPEPQRPSHNTAEETLAEPEALSEEKSVDDLLKAYLNPKE